MKMRNTLLAVSVTFVVILLCPVCASTTTKRIGADLTGYAYLFDPKISNLWPRIAEKLQGSEETKEPDNPTDIDINSRIKIDEGDFEEKSEQWMAENQSTVRDAMRWIICAGVIVIVCTGVFLFSEIRQAIIVKEVDAANYQVPAELMERKRSADTQRPYLSVGSSLITALAVFVILSTVCDIVSSLLESAAGYRYRGCWQVAALTSIIAASVWSLLLLAACWVCVRPYAAGACFLASVSGVLTLTSLDGPSFLVWAVVTSIGAFALVRYGGPEWTLDARPPQRKAGERASLLD